MGKEKIKLIMELIFIFILPLILLTMSIDFKTTKTYDTNNNEIEEEKTLEYDNFILKRYLNYSNYLDFNQLKITSNGEFNNTLNGYEIFARENCTVIVGHIYFVSLDIIVNNTNSISFKLGNPGYSQFKIDCNTTGHYEKRAIIEEINEIETTQLSFFRVGPNGGQVDISYYNIQVFDLTKIFGSGYEPSIEEFKSYIDTNIIYDYTESEIITIKDNSIISENYSINYTPIEIIKHELTDVLNINNTITVNIIYDYTILWIIMFLLWHIIYGLFELIFHVIPKGRLRC